MNEKQRGFYLQAMGVDVWKLRGQTHSQDKEAQPVSVQEATIPTEQLDWEPLQERVSTCVACPLHRSRTQTVFGVGDHNADLLIVGEAPGANEDKQGEPFVGRAGKLLNAMLHAIGLAREAVYIANIIKCRPPNNRDPNPEEVETCSPYLDRQVELLQPKLMVAVGRVAAHYLLSTDAPLGRLRGKEFTFRDTQIPLIITYHPAYLLRSPKQKAKAMDDLQQVYHLLKRMKK